MYANLVELEATQAQKQAFMMTVPLDQLIESCAFNGDMDMTAGYCCHHVTSEEATQIREDPPESPPCSMQGSCSPIKDGEDAVEKLLHSTVCKTV